MSALPNEDAARVARLLAMLLGVRFGTSGRLRAIGLFGQMIWTSTHARPATTRIASGLVGGFVTTTGALRRWWRSIRLLVCLLLVALPTTTQAQSALDCSSAVDDKT